MEKFTRKECNKITKMLKPDVENFTVTESQLNIRFENNEKDKEQFRIFGEGIKMMSDNPNSIFEKLEEKFLVLPMYLFVKLYGSSDLTFIDPKKLDATMGKVIDLLVELGMFSQKNNPYDN